MVDQDIGGLRRDDDFERLIRRHRARHAVRQADTGDVVALAAAGLVCQIGLEIGLIFRGQRGLLSAPVRLARIVGRLADRARHAGAGPLALPVRILRCVLRKRACNARQQRCRERERRDCTNPDSPEHAVLPCKRTHHLPDVNLAHGQCQWSSAPSASGSGTSD